MLIVIDGGGETLSSREPLATPPKDIRRPPSYYVPYTRQPHKDEEKKQQQRRRRRTKMTTRGKGQHTERFGVNGEKKVQERLWSVVGWFVVRKHVREGRVCTSCSKRVRVDGVWLPEKSASIARPAHQMALLCTGECVVVQAVMSNAQSSNILPLARDNGCTWAAAPGSATNAAGTNSSSTAADNRRSFSG